MPSFLPLQLKYKEKHVKERGTCHAVPDTPQILLAKTVSHLVSEVTPQLPMSSASLLGEHPRQMP